MDNYNGVSIDVIKKMIQQQIENIYRIVTNNSGLSNQIYLKYQKEYINIMKIKKTKEKIIKLNELYDKLDKTYNELKKIEFKLVHIIPKIRMGIYSNIYSSMITAKAEKQLGYSKLTEILELTDTELLLKEITQLSQQIDDIINITEELLQGKDTVKYNLEGIIVRVEPQKKKCYITFTAKLIDLLETCKVNKLKELLAAKLSNIPFDEIIEPKYIGNEFQLSKVIMYDDIPVKEILKYDINTLLVQIGASKEINKKYSIEEIYKYNESIQKFILLINSLDTLGYKIDNKEENINYIEGIYNRINLNLSEKAYEEIAPIIARKYPNESFVYSSLQLVYNSLGNELRERLHNELSNNDYKKQTVFVNYVINLIQKYARKKDQSIYQYDEILNFLKQKNEIVNTQYAYNDFEKMEEYSDIADIDQILFNLTGKRR